MTEQKFLLQRNKAGFPVCPKYQQEGLHAAGGGNSLCCVELTQGVHTKGEGTVHEAPAEKIYLACSQHPGAGEAYGACGGQYRLNTVLV